MNSQPPLALPELSLAEYQFTSMLAQSGALPQPLGTALRGGLALLLRRSVCIHPELVYCRDCSLRRRCAYPAVFEPAPPEQSEVLSTHQDVPLPLALRLPHSVQGRCQAGDEFGFGLILVGSALQYLAYIIAAIEQLGHNGLGQDRIPFRLQRVTCVGPQPGDANVVYEAGLMHSGRRSFSLQALAAGETAVTDVTLRFITPTRLTFDKQVFRSTPPFHVVIRTLLRRLSSLSYFHGGQRWDIDYRGWIERAQAVETAAADVKWVDWERYSTRQQQRMNLGGIVGRVTYAGDLGPFLPLLRVGELIHVGKNVVFGHGQYRLAVEPSSQG